MFKGLLQLGIGQYANYHSYLTLSDIFVLIQKQMTTYSDIRVQNISILVVADPDFVSVTALSEKLIQSKPSYDCIIVVGPFIHKDITTAEESAVALSDIAAIIAQLENIVCRVIYLSAESDPVKVLTQQMHLTPNSVNIHARKLNIYKNMFVAGFTEKSENINTVDLESMQDHDEEEMTTKHLESQTTPSIIQELLLSEFSCEYNFDDLTIEKFHQSTNFQHSTTLPSTEDSGYDSYGIFVFNYKYAHSLSYFMFHMNGIVDAANVKLCIIPGVGSSASDASRLPRIFGGLSIVVPRSLRLEGEFTHISFKVKGSSGREIELEEIRTLNINE